MKINYDNSMKILLLLFSSLSLSYFVTMMISLGSDYIFNYVWLLLGISLLIIYFNISRLSLLPLWLKKIGKATFFTALFSFIIVEALIIAKGYTSEPKEAADYLIILGAKVDGRKPSKRLKDRLDISLPYLFDNTETKIIVSGGQGEDEDISEASAMKEYLISKGINEARIIMEENSTSTQENFIFTKKLIDNKNSSFIIVTSDYHMLRASMIAKNTGYSNISGITVKSNPLLAPNFYTREFLAFVKDWLSIVI